jgi:hypothetical protein
LSPALAGFEFEMDLNAGKAPQSIKSPFVISSLKSKKPVASFGCKLKPMELNIIYSIPGNDFTLSATGDVRDSWLQSIRRNTKFQNYFYIHASLKQLIYFIFTTLFRRAGG